MAANWIAACGISRNCCSIGSTSYASRRLPTLARLLSPNLNHSTHSSPSLLSPIAATASFATTRSSTPLCDPPSLDQPPLLPAARLPPLPAALCMHPRAPAIASMRMPAFAPAPAPPLRAAFVKSSSALGQLPAGRHPEVALMGHSNVGKSSLINAMTGQQGLARVSNKPGSTRVINHYLISGSWYLVDCPGYGHARVSKQQRAEWHALTQDYLLQRRSLALALLLVDSSQLPNKLDVDAAAWLHEEKVPFAIVFTKADAAPAGTTTVQQNISTFVRALDAVTVHVGVPYVATSSLTREGVELLLRYIEARRSTFKVPVVFH